MEMQNLPTRVLSFSRNSSSLRSYDRLEHALPKSPMADEPPTHSGRSRSRCCIASICCALALIATITLGTVLAVRARSGHSSPSDSQNQHQPLSTGSAAVAAACNATMFPDLCYEWLMADPSAITANPVRLAGIGVKIALSHVHDASSLASKLSLGYHQVNLSKQAIEDCLELMDLSNDQLNDSITGLSSISLLSVRSSLTKVKTKLSGTMGFQLACSEGLLAVLPHDGSLSALVESQDIVGKGVIISLGLVDTLSKLGNDLSSWKDAAPKIHLRRRLLSHDGHLSRGSDLSEYMPDTFSFSQGDGFPEWLSVADRKLLQASTPSEPSPQVTPSTTSPPVTPVVSSPAVPTPPATASAPPPSTTSSTLSPPASPSATSPPAAPSVSSPSTPPVTASVTSPPPPVPISSPSTTPTVMAPSTTPSVSSASGGFDAVVAQDGSGNYKTIKEAIDNVPSKRSTRYTIYIKKGTYSEYVLIPKAMKLLTLIGDGMGQTIITGDKSNKQDITTYQTATVAVSGPNFIARKISFRNTAGPDGHQAVALRVNSDQAVFDACSFEGYQDTLYALANRQFYTGCNIYGTIDFIFGNAIAVFQNSNILGRRPLANQHNTFTAQGRKVSSDPSGFSFQKCTIGADAELSSAPFTVTSYFGRPWKAYSRTVFLQCNIGKVIDPAGWVAWDATNPFTDTLYYGEYQNTGDGAGTSQRIAWKGVHPSMSVQEATAFTVEGFISGSSWLPEAKVSFQDSLS
eukprot:c16204_g1_i1 orf=495-2729(+)